jgi:hypothetical protein
LVDHFLWLKLVGSSVECVEAGKLFKVAKVQPKIIIPIVTISLPQNLTKRLAFKFGNYALLGTAWRLSARLP